MKLKQARLPLFMIWYCVYCAACNVANAVTPVVIKNLNIPDYMFGISYATMAFFSFLSAPFWGKLSDKHGRGWMLTITCLGGALGQFFFSLAFDPFSLVFARMFTGLFSGGHTICSLAYFSDLSDEESRGRNMATSAILASVFSALGYLLGGVLGDTSTALAFNVQVTLLFFCGLTLPLLIGEPKSLIIQSVASTKRVKQKHNISFALKVIFTIQFISAIGVNAFDQAFGYYLADNLNFPPSYNGYIKAGIAILSLIANFTITMSIIKKGNISFSQILSYAGSSITLYVILGMKSTGLFIFTAVVFFFFSSIQTTLLQVVAVKEFGQGETGYLLGRYNGFQNLGAVAGSLVSGFAYSKGVRLPFLISSLTFALVTILSIFHFIQQKRKLLAE